MDKNSKIYVAGHQGLVGSALVRELKSYGYNNLVLKTKQELNLIDTKEVLAFFEKEKPDFVFLAAAKVGGIHANNIYRADFIYQNLMIQNNVIHSSYLHRVKKLLFLGSTCIYPKNAKQPISENSMLTGELEYTNEPYAIAKIAGIKMCESYNLQYNTNFISVMPTNLYGPNDNFNLETSHVLPALMRKLYLAKLFDDNDWEGIKKDFKVNSNKILNGTKDIIQCLSQYGIIKDESGKTIMKVWGSGRPKREFMWSEDLANACIFIMNNVDFHDLVNLSGENRNTHINIGTGEELSIMDLCNLINGFIGFKGGVQYDVSKPDGTIRKVTRVEKLHKIGWKHKVKLRQGVEQLYNWYLNQTLYR